jgi:hypothetical protein
MLKMKKIAVALATAGLLVSGSALAALIDRGGGLIYDSTLNITWLKDANYSQTSGYDNDGRMNWDAANVWAAGLSYGGYSDWRLPTTTDLGFRGCNFAYGGTDCGYNVATNSSELAHLFFIDLGNLSRFDAAGNGRSGSAGVDWGVVNTGPFDKLMSGPYWSGTADHDGDSDGIFNAWGFNTVDGSQFSGGQSNEAFAWAVRPGNVATTTTTTTTTVPEPASGLLVGLALAGLAALRRRRSLGA